MRPFHVYILASHSKTLYAGVTNDLARRVFEHKHDLSVFSSHYRVHRLVYYECADSPIAAINREKQLKGLAEKEKGRAHREDKPDVARPFCWLVRLNLNSQ